MITDFTSQVLSSNTYNDLAKQAREEVFWKGSLFEPIKLLSSRSIGAKGEQITADLLEAIGSMVPRDKKGAHKKPKGAGSDYDLYIDNIKIEVKFSTAWNQTENKFTWQQLRSGQDYERVIFVGCNPNEIHFWWCHKSDLEANIFGRDEYRQHAGKSGKQDLYWLHTDPTAANIVPDYFKSLNTWTENA